MLYFNRIAVLIAAISLFFLINAQKLSANEQEQIQQLTSQFLPAEFGKGNFSLEDAKALLRKKCKKAATLTDTTDIYDKVEKAALKLTRCANEIVNITLIMEEVEDARPRGELDNVFQKYCDKQPLAEKCLHDFNAALKPCLTREERQQNDVMMRIVTSLLNFICYKNGDQIALFIAEEGPECLEANKENISNCMNATFSAYLPRQENGSIASNLVELPELVLGPKQCIDLRDFEECVLSYLEKCNEITPANIIESMFRYVKNETKCQTETEKQRIAEGKSGAVAFDNVWSQLMALAATMAIITLKLF